MNEPKLFLIGDEGDLGKPDVEVWLMHEKPEFV